MLAAQLRHRRASLGLLEYGDDLAVGEAGCLHKTSSEKEMRKFHFWRLLLRGGITRLPVAIQFEVPAGTSMIINRIIDICGVLFDLATPCFNEQRTERAAT